MIRFFFTLIGLLFFLATLALFLISAGAALGFIHPALDVFNHLQPLIFIGTLSLLLFSPIFIKNKKWQSINIAIAATGFISSAVIVVPEFVLGLSVEKSEAVAGTKQYKLLSQNLFGLNYDMQRMATAIKKEDPDIIALQEYFSVQRADLHPLLVKDYPYYFLCVGGKRANIAIYSKLKFEKLSASDCAKNTQQRTSRIFVKIVNDGNDFTIVTTHFDWPVRISQFKKGNDFSEKLDLAFARKKGQLSEFAKALEDVNGPLLIGADFNSTSWSYELRNFAKDNGLKLLTRSLLTYPNKLNIFGWRDVFPFISLDHMMSKGDIKIYELRKGDAAGSDHNPVIIRFSV
ncbi:MAG: endonuclease/exonuclease/phosphatase family protein [Devosiaceae bacterium]|nr:endonuclease/exonuclease/phosphatase family protein [Devosiaceae bacterium]